MWAQLTWGTLALVGAGALAVKWLYPWIQYDISYIVVVFKMLRNLKKRVASKELFIDVFEEVVRKTPDKTFMIFEDEPYSYRYMEEQAIRVARAVMDLGVTCGDTVSVFIGNEPDFLWTLLGIWKVGAKPVLINTSVRDKSLVHMLLSGNPRLLIVGKDLVEAVSAVSADLPSVPVYAYGTSHSSIKPFPSFDDLMASASVVPVDPSVRSSITHGEAAAFIFTSGTTGLPKAALFSHRKFLAASYVISMCGMTSRDTIYITLPLYHSSGLSLGVGSAVQLGATMVLKRKFSASAFWEDCRKHNVTVILYIGELCRYLVSRPRRSADRLHNVRLAFGNGLRTDIWEEFQERFHIPKIAEFYGATEGPASLLNVANKVGAVGRISPILQKIVPTVLVEYNTVDATPVRDSNRRCIPIRPGSVGLLLSPVSGRFPYHGYLGTKTSSDRKLIRDVFVPGDVYFNTGDVLYLDKEYFVYFNDRLGDTFRWKGENVSTTEVANVLTETKFILDSNVYGVKIPGQEGRSGMAAILANDGRPLTEGQRSAIYRLCEDLLASYARPRFLRVLKEGQMTETFKQKKRDLVEQGFDVNVIQDPLYFLDQESKNYVPLDEKLYLRVINGGVKV